MHEFLYSLGWLTWPLVVAIFVYLLRRLDGSQQGKASRLWYWAHVGVVLLALILLHDALYWLIESYELWNTAWASVIFMLAATGVLAVLTRQSAYTASLGDAPARWPLRPYGRAYVKTAAGLLATVLVLATLGVAVSSRAHAPPLPYVPLLNPTDISLLLALAVVALYLLRMRAFGLLGQSAAGAPALGSLRRAAEALNCTLVYAIVPNNSTLENIVLDRARKKATKILAGVNHTMALEDQNLSDEDIRSEIENLAHEIIVKKPRIIWDEKP